MKNEHFKYKDCWEGKDGYDAQGNILNKKVPKVLEFVPDDVETIIDIGCGNGIITNKLGELFDVLGVDFSHEALKHVNTRKLCVSASQIPLESNSFDMVFSSQLLEHIEEPELTKTIKEFKRLAKKYILITVPNDEFLKKNETKCPKCNAIFNVNGHVNSFSINKLVDKFNPEYKLLASDVFGERHLDYNPFLMKIRQKYGNRFFNPVSFTICPICQNTNFPVVEGNLISKFSNGINRIISRKRPYWQIVLLEKKNSK